MCQLRASEALQHWPWQCCHNPSQGDSGLCSSTHGQRFVEVVEVDLGTLGVRDLNPLTCRFGDGKVHQDCVMVGEENIVHHSYIPGTGGVGPHQIEDIVFPGVFFDLLVTSKLFSEFQPGHATLGLVSLVLFISFLCPLVK